MRSAKNTDEPPKAAEPAPLDYVERTNRAIDYIVRNLDGALRLEDVARAGCFSPFHFHRVFRSLVGETLNQFVRRQRVERALFLMSHAPGRSLTEIAHECGFSSSSDFSRSFKQRFGVPPSAFDLRTFRDSQREEFASLLSEQSEGVRFERLPVGQNPDGFEVRLRDLPARSVTYLRVLDPFRPDVVPDACRRLVNWAEERGLADGQWLGYMWEDPEITKPKDCRYDVAVVVEDDGSAAPRPDGEVGRFAFPPMQVAEVALSGDIELEMRALDWIFGTWLPESGFEPAEQPAFEAWQGRPFAHGMEHFELSCQLPVRRAR